MNNDAWIGYNATSQLNTKYGSNLYERVRVTVDG